MNILDEILSCLEISKGKSLIVGNMKIQKPWQIEGTGTPCEFQLIMNAYRMFYSLFAHRQRILFKHNYDNASAIFHRYANNAFIWTIFRNFPWKKLRNEWIHVRFMVYNFQLHFYLWVVIFSPPWLSSIRANIMYSSHKYPHTHTHWIAEKAHIPPYSLVRNNALAYKSKGINSFFSYVSYPLPQYAGTTCITFFLPWVGAREISRSW